MRQLKPHEHSAESIDAAVAQAGETMTPTRFLRLFGVKVSSERIEKRSGAVGTGFGDNASHWCVTIRRGRRWARLEYSMGSAHKGTPDPADVLHCMISDAGIGRLSFRDFCVDFGYDADKESRSIWRECQRIGEKLERLFPGSLDTLETVWRDY